MKKLFKKFFENNKLFKKLAIYRLWKKGFIKDYDKIKKLNFYYNIDI